MMVPAAPYQGLVLGNILKSRGLPPWLQSAVPDRDSTPPHSFWTATGGTPLANLETFGPPSGQVRDTAHNLEPVGFVCCRASLLTAPLFPDWERRHASRESGDLRSAKWAGQRHRPQLSALPPQLSALPPTTFGAAPTTSAPAPGSANRSSLHNPGIRWHTPAIC